MAGQPARKTNKNMKSRKKKPATPPIPVSAASGPRTSLQDLPEDIIHEIAGMALDIKDPDGRYLRHLCQVPDTDEDETNRKRVIAKRKQGLSNLLALSSCCKWLRGIIFPSWILRQLVVRLSRKEMEALKDLPIELRQEIR
jgi:hypothetical protein